MTASHGIDFGTTNSVVAQWSGDRVDVLPVDEPPAVWAEQGFDRVLPTVLAVAPSDGAMSFGWAARRSRDPKLAAVKRLFATDEFVQVGATKVPVEESAALLFAHLRSASAGVTVDRAVVTVPANSLGLARSRTKLCAGLSGISVPALINEPTAAAMAFARTSRRDETVLVFDWGGGTLDVTVLEAVDGVFMERASKGVARLGGIDLDRAFAATIEEQLPPHEWSPAQREQFVDAVEYAKVRLSQETEVQLPTPGGPAVPVDRRMLERAVSSLITVARGPIEQCLEDLGMRPGDVDQLVMAGGTSKIPAVRTMVADAVGREAAAGLDPMTAVAEGAAIASAILAGDLDLDFFVSTEHALGTVVHNSGRPRFSVLIPRNHQLPARATDRYTPVNDGQSEVLIRVVEGDPDKPVDDPENALLRELPVPIDADVSREEASFDITYSYDVDGILEVVVTDVRSGREMLREDVSGPPRDRSALVGVAQQVRAASAAGRLHAAEVTAAATPTDPRVVEVVATLRRRVIPFVDDGERARLEQLAQDAETADADGVDARLEALRRELRSYSYLL